MKRKLMKLTALLLSAMMVAALLPAPALARAANETYDDASYGAPAAEEAETDEPTKDEISSKNLAPENPETFEFDTEAAEIIITEEEPPLNSPDAVVYAGTFTALVLAMNNALPYTDTTIYITADISMTSIIPMPANKSFTITSDGRPYTLSRGTSTTGNLFTLPAGASLAFANIIIGGRTNAGGSLVYVNGGTFEMYSGATLEKNNNNAGSGGAVRIDAGTFTMFGGEISENSSQYGGGVYMQGGTFIMSGGSITGNSSSLTGGGVYMAGDAFTMTGGTISGNSSSSDGGGVRYNGGTFTIGGGAVITSNTVSGGAANNVTLFTGRYLTLGTGANAPASGMTVGVTKTDDNAVFVQSRATSAHVARFFADNGGIIEYNSGQLRILTTSYSVSNFTALENAVNNAPTGVQVTITVTASFSMTGLITIPANKSITIKSNAVIRTLSRGTSAVGHLFTVSAGATLVFEDITINGNKTAIQNGGAALVLVNGGIFTMFSGAMLGNNGITTASVDGGCVYVTGSGSIFTMNGGMINNNSTSRDGGGVMINGGIFYMNGGTISDNNAGVGGGGVMINGGGMFNMNGGTLSGNSADLGGGVDVWGGVFTMTGGTITGNSASSISGGVHFENGTCTIGSSAVVENNTVGGARSNIYLIADRYITLGTGIYTPTTAMRAGITKTADNSVFVQSGATSAHAALFFADNGGIIEHDGGQLRIANATFSVSSFTALENAIANAPTGVPATITVTASFSMTGLITIPANKDITIKSDATMRIITRGAGVSGNLFTVSSGGTLTLENIIIDGDKSLVASANGSLVRVNGGALRMNAGSTLRNNAADFSNGGSVYVTANGTFTMNGGAISGNTAGSNGGGVYVSGSGSSFTMNGGAISGNIVGYGGGVYVYNGGTFTMNGGTISGNTAYNGGGGGVRVAGTFTMTGGTISENTAEFGGGVYVSSIATFTMTGGEISGNTADYGGGGGVYMDQSDIIALGGSAVIENNTSSGAASNIYLPNSGRYLTLETGSNAPTSFMRVGVTKTADNGVFVQSGATSAYATCFFADNGGMIEHSSGQLRVAGTTFSVSSFTALQAAINNAPTGVHATITVTASFDMTGLIEIPANKDITIKSDSTLRTMTRGAGVSGNLFSLASGAKLTLENITIDGNKSVVVNTSGVLVRVNGGALTMNTGATLQNNSNSGLGSGVYVTSIGTFTMTGGAISGNTAGYGGGVEMYGTFTMTGGSITGNSATRGGGVDLDGSTFTMTGGTISGNTAGGGGGVYFSSISAFTVGGGATITNNTLTEGAANNVALTNDRYITIGTGANAPASGMIVGVTKTADNGVFVHSGAQAAHAARFFADNGGVIEFDKGQLRIVAATLPTAATPVASHASGTVAAGTQVTLSCETQGATIRYTLDGSEPMETSAQYTTPITINATLTLKAKAYATGYTPSDTATYSYTVDVIDPNAPTITVNNARGMSGKKAFVPISISNNPGITGMVIDVHYDESALRIIGFEDTRLLNAPIHAPVTKSPVTLAWADGLATVNNMGNGVIAILEFEVIATELGDYAVWVTYDYGNILNANNQFVPFEIVNGHVAVIDFIYGDVNDDGIINLQDTYVLQRYIARWPDYPAEALNLDAADVNADGIINLQDGYTLQRHVARWPGYGTLPYIPSGPQASQAMTGANESIFEAPSPNASRKDSPTLRVGEAAGKAGETVKVPVTITRNPGITGLVFTLSFDDTKLRLIGYEDTGLLPGALHPLHDGLSSATFAWMNALQRADYTNSGVLVILEFELLQDAEPGGYEIGLAYEQGNILNAGMAPVHFDVASGTVTVQETLPSARRS